MSLRSVTERKKTHTEELVAIWEGLAAIQQQLSSFSALQRLVKRLKEEENIEAQMDLFRKLFRRAPIQESVPIEETYPPTELLAMDDSIERTESMDSMHLKDTMSLPENPAKELQREEEEKKLDQPPRKVVIPLFHGEYTRNMGLQVDPCLEIGNYLEIEKLPAMRCGFADEFLHWYQWERDRKYFLDRDKMKFWVWVLEEQLQVMRRCRETEAVKWHRWERDKNRWLNGVFREEHYFKLKDVSEEEKIREMQMGFKDEISKWYRWERDKTKFWALKNFLVEIVWNFCCLGQTSEEYS